MTRVNAVTVTPLVQAPTSSPRGCPRFDMAKLFRIACHPCRWRSGSFSDSASKVSLTRTPSGAWLNWPATFRPSPNLYSLSSRGTIREYVRARTRPHRGRTALPPLTAPRQPRGCDIRPPRLWPAGEGRGSSSKAGRGSLSGAAPRSPRPRPRGSGRCSRGLLTIASSFMRPWHLGQARTSTPNVRARSSAHGRYPPARFDV